MISQFYLENRYTRKLVHKEQEKNTQTSPVYVFTCVPVYLCTCVPVYLCTCVTNLLLPLFLPYHLHANCVETRIHVKHLTRDTP